MNISVKLHEPFIGFRWLIPLLIVQGAVIGISAYYPLYVSLAVAGIAVAYYTLKKTHRALCVLILFHAIILKQSEEISLVEVAFGMYLVIFIATWAFRKALLQGRPLLVFRRDYWLVTFLGLCVLSIIPTIITGNSALGWFRNLVPFATLALYFPASEIFPDSRKRNLILLSFMTLAFAVGIQNILNYRQNLLEAAYYWQVASARQVSNEPLFLTVIIIVTGMFMYTRSRMFKGTALGLLLFFGLAMLVTFSRGYWVASVLGVGLVFWFIDVRRKLRFLVLAFVFGVVIFVSLVALFGDITPYLTQSLAQRAGSIAKAQTDISIVNRLAESEAIWEKIYKNPIVGYGLGAKFSFFDVIRLTTRRTDYAHNVYLYFWFKLGILGLISFIAFYALYIRGSYRLFRETPPSAEKGLAVGLVALLLAMIPLSLTSPQFLQKDSLLIITLVCGYISSRQIAPRPS